ncbi:hypothetical protein T440DRAFT_475629 [Plenodomus tracheiphilus IPT5]|uniref:Uncharacterized protein n=1 Tax=Plenodomus tracheiphilus IPT5 TaxID=1408161 RepID=A0A6A7BGE5_9PLEO|nr:hypothetical protein T440DRAFT_475629 [Plenodomus tracheiphilus IPT5]
MTFSVLSFGALIGAPAAGAVVTENRSSYVGAQIFAASCLAPELSSLPQQGNAIDEIPPVTSGSNCRRRGFTNQTWASTYSLTLLILASGNLHLALCDGFTLKIVVYRTSQAALMGQINAVTVTFACD